MLIRNVIEMNSLLMPKLKEALEVNLYFNEEFDADQAIINALTQSNFVLRSGECYIDLTWMSSVIRNMKNLKSRLQLSECLSVFKKGRYHSYFRCFMEIVNG